jgi:alpha-L-fucosidase
MVGNVGNAWQQLGNSDGEVVDVRAERACGAATRETERPMGMPRWWDERRFGVLVTASTATVPGWAPIGADAGSYREHLDGQRDARDGDDSGAGQLVEVLAHHRERWGHIDRFDDFTQLLGFDRFDAEAWARLIIDAGAGYAVVTARHHDGWAWWDSPGTSTRLTDIGPRRNVVAEFAAACERNDLVFGTSYALLVAGDDEADTSELDERAASTTDDQVDQVDQVVQADVLDLVSRYGASLLWGEGPRVHDSGRWQSAQLSRAASDIDPDVVFDDRWALSSRDRRDDATRSADVVRTFEVTPPIGIVDGPWELRRSLGSGFGYNRCDHADHHLSSRDIVSLYTEVLAKGGHLLLTLGPTADGTIPPLQADPLRLAGRWIRRFDGLLSRSQPWESWGDSGSRLLQMPDNSLIAVDVAGDGRFEIDARDHRVTSVTRLSGASAVDASPSDETPPVAFEHDGVTLQIARDPRSARNRTLAPRNEPGRNESERHEPGGNELGGNELGIEVYRIMLQPVDRPVELFEPTDAEPIPLAPLLADARPGDVIQLGDGTYLGPVEVPDRVVVRGFGAVRTRLVNPATGIAPPAPVVTLHGSARLEYVSVEPSRGVGPVAPVVSDLLVSLSGPNSAVLGSTVEGQIDVTGDDATLRAVTGRSVVVRRAQRVSLLRCTFTGHHDDVGVRLVGGDGHRIESSAFTDHLCAIQATDTTGTDVRGNSITARRWGVRLERTEDAHVHANHVRSTMRAVDIDGGAHASVDGNAVIGGDSGCIVQGGAADCLVSGNHWERCRIGLLAWDTTDLHHHDNVAIDLLDPDGAALHGP